MEEKRLGNEKEELNYKPTCQSSIHKHYSTSTPSILSSNEEDKVTTSAPENAKCEVVCDDSNVNRTRSHNVERIDNNVTGQLVVPEDKCMKVTSNKNASNVAAIEEQIETISDNTEFNNDKIKIGNLQNALVATENKYLSNNISSSPIQEPSRQTKDTSLSRGKQIEPTTTSSEVDYISEAYRDIIKQINDASEGFKRGKKWKCNNPAHCHHHHNHQHYHQPHCPQYSASRTEDPLGSKQIVLERGRNTLLLNQQKIRMDSKDSDITPMSSFDGTVSEGKERVLVRQMSTAHSQDYDPEDIEYYDDDEDIAIVVDSYTQQKIARSVG